MLWFSIARVLKTQSSYTECPPTIFSLFTAYLRSVTSSRLPRYIWCAQNVVLEPIGGNHDLMHHVVHLNRFCSNLKWKDTSTISIFVSSTSVPDRRVASSILLYNNLLYFLFISSRTLNFVLSAVPSHGRTIPVVCYSYISKNDRSFTESNTIVIWSLF